jgi:seryl-tRNA(Sec) selenium transferase
MPALMSSAAATAATGSLTPGPEIYQSIGVEPVINCRGTFTIIGGSVERPEVREAVSSATLAFAQLDELAEGVGKRLAELTGAEWGMVSGGCAAGMKHVTAACVAGGNPEHLLRIPDLTGLQKTEVIIPRSSRTVYDHSIRNVGVTIIMVETPEELANAINPRTAMIYLTSGDGADSGPLALEAVAKIGKPKNIPILVDAAAQILTIPNVHLQKGASVVTYSGGKALCGPQCAGLLLGQKDILMSAWQASSPHHGPGRDNKVGREETLGMLAAVEAWVKRDHEGEWKTWLSWLETISRRVSAIDGVQTAVVEPTGLGNRSPRLSITWDSDRLHVSGEEVADELGRGKPRIALGANGGRRRGRGRDQESDSNETGISVTAWMMQPGEDRIVADRIHAVLSQKRAPKSAPKPPAANLSGRWTVSIEYSSSKSEHTFFLEQEGNRIRGSHQGNFSSSDLHGMIDGDQIVMRSRFSQPGDSVNFTFSGAVSGDTMEGPIHLGEYLTAKYTAKRDPFAESDRPLMIPKGPPLAN